MQKVNGVTLQVHFGERAYTCETVRPEEVSDTRKFIVSMVGEVTPMDEMERLTAHNPQWLHVVKRKGIAGAFAVFHLNEESSARFGQNKMRGADITLDHIVHPSGAHSIYIGSIVSDANLFNRAATLKSFKSTMEFFQTAAQRDLPIFTRPVSEDGLRMITAGGGKPVIDAAHELGGMIYRIA